MRRPAWLDSLLGAAPRPPIRPSQGSREKNQESDGADRSSDRHAVTITRPLPNNGQRAQQIPVISHDEEYQDPAAEPRAELGPRRSHDSISDDGTTTPRPRPHHPQQPTRAGLLPLRAGPRPATHRRPLRAQHPPSCPLLPAPHPSGHPFRRRIRPRRPGPHAQADDGQEGKDAWTVLGGRVYNMSPYLPFHPG
ncbi:hypothetical protein N0V88_006062 [Collariella sp. IMI 366227]|nr:hypothetical protein N0V88_006062 [Collariella sp. IMI 366227]